MTTFSVLDLLYVRLARGDDGNGGFGEIVRFSFARFGRKTFDELNAFSFATAIVNVAGSRLVLSLKTNARVLQMARSRAPTTIGQSRLVFASVRLRRLGLSIARRDADLLPFEQQFCDWLGHLRKPRFPCGRVHHAGRVVGYLANWYRLSRRT